MAIAQAQGEWMTSEFVPFKAKLEFQAPQTETGVLVFIKDNPSGIRELDNELRVPVHFVVNTRTIKLYYYNRTRDREIADFISCSEDAVLPIEREIPVTMTPIQDTIKLFLRAKLTDQEKELGFDPVSPNKLSALISANLKDGHLILRFEKMPGAHVGGSCLSVLMNTELAKTIQQFSEVETLDFEPRELFEP